MMKVEVRLYNSLRKLGEQISREIELESEVTVAEIVQKLGIDGRNIYVAFKNGTPLGRGLHDAAETVVCDGDVLALSGPIPFSWAYGAPVV